MSAFEIFKDFSDDDNELDTVPIESNLSKISQQREQVFNQKKVNRGDLPLQTRPKVPLAAISHNVAIRDSINTNMPKAPFQSVPVNLISTTPFKFPTPPVAQFQAFKVYEDKENFPKMVLKNNTNTILAASTKTSNLETKSEIKPDNATEVSTNVQPVVNSPMICDDNNGNDKSEANIEKQTISTQTSVGQLPFYLRQFYGLANDQQAYNLFQLEQFAKNLIPEVNEYESDIHNYLREVETENRPKALYIRQQPEVTEKMRSVLIDWLVEVAEEYRLQTETLYLAISYIDRFLSQMTITKNNLQLLGTASLFIATKYEEIYPPELSEFIYVTDDSYTRDQMLTMERKIVQVLQFKLSLPPTPLAFIKQFCAVHKFSQKTMHFAMYLCELSCLNSENYLLYLPSTLAASSVLLARYHLINNDNNDAHELSSIIRKRNSGSMSLSDDGEKNDVTDGDKLVSVMDYFGKKPTACHLLNCNTLEAMNVSQSTPIDKSTTSTTNDDRNYNMKEIWPQSLETYTRYSVSDLFQCVTYLQTVYVESPNMKLVAIRNKYQDMKYSSVSSIIPKSQTIQISDLKPDLKPDSNLDLMSE